MEFKNGTSIANIKDKVAHCVRKISETNMSLLGVRDRLNHRDKMAKEFLADIVAMMGACRIMVADFLIEVRKEYDPESMSLSQKENDEIDAMDVDDDMNKLY